MTQPGSAVAGRILMVSGVVAAIGGGLFLAGVVPVPRGTGVVIGSVLLGVGLVDGLLGMWLVNRERQS
jgi:hypothetical protein